LTISDKNTFSNEIRQRIKAAAFWLSGLLDQSSGSSWNLGANDGAYILPLSTGSYSDCRPSVQLILRAMNHPGIYADPAVDEMAAWMGYETFSDKDKQPTLTGFSEGYTRSEGADSHGLLRVSQFNSRPGHADQLHFDLWQNGVNILQDPGTYSYNLEEPWNNALAGSKVHNSVTIDGYDQMTRLGKFLWVDWAQAQIIDYHIEPTRISAQHDGYRKLGLIHRRTVSYHPDECWMVVDKVLPVNSRGSRTHQIDLHWLLPDWDWTIDGLVLHAHRRNHSVQIETSSEPVIAYKVSIIRAGVTLLGGRECKQLGWVSPHYYQLLPALSFSISVHAVAPFCFRTMIRLGV
jgi:hypothetical protein